MPTQIFFTQWLVFRLFWGPKLSFFRGIYRKSAKILTMEAKTVKTKKKTESGQKWLKSTKWCDYFDPL